MKPWQIRLADALSDDDAPPALTRDLLARFAQSARDAHIIPSSTLTNWIRRAVESGKLTPVQRGLYLNGFRNKHAHLASAIPWLHSDAIVSLSTVLGDAGVLNNPSSTITAVVPLDRTALPHLGRKRTRSGNFHFFGLPRRILEAGKPVDRIQPADNFEFPCATPEKALIDWLYLGQSPRSNRTPPPRGDIEITMIDLPRLRRLASSAGLVEVLAKWIDHTSDVLTKTGEIQS